MKRISRINIFGCVLLLLFLVKQSYSQDNDESTINPVDQILKYTESVYNADDRLINGTYYIPEHPRAIGHPYYITDDWLLATLYIKGLTYGNVGIKYNIEDDHIILKRQHKLGLIEEILLNNSLIDSLRIDDHLFINTSLMNVPGSPGFLEVIYRGKLMYFLKHKREHKDELSELVRYGKYLDSRRILYLLDDKKFIKVNDKQAFFDIFTTHQKEIKKFMRKNNIRYKKATKDQFVILLKYCDEL